eukprot:scaffold5320_cov350-Prasinococcus_capsulatus_cf.AAC.2
MLLSRGAPSALRSLRALRGAARAVSSGHPAGQSEPPRAPPPGELGGPAYDSRKSDAPSGGGSPAATAARGTTAAAVAAPPPYVEHAPENAALALGGAAAERRHRVTPGRGGGGGGGAGAAGGGPAVAVAAAPSAPPSPPPSSSPAAAPPAELPREGFSAEALAELGIGGLDEAVAQIFRRALASRVVGPEVSASLGLAHVRGILLHGPPGTGKTLVARRLGALLSPSSVPPKVVNGPEVLSKFVGESEQNVRRLFADAERDFAQLGAASPLHVIIFDEIDAVCKQRGSSAAAAAAGGGQHVGDSIVNQLLTKIDGVHALNNILLIAITNRRDLLDEAMLRPGRLEVQIEVGLPDREGRAQILRIHTSKLREERFLAEDVDLEALAGATRNYSGAELEGLTRAAVSHALQRMLNPPGREDARTHGRHGARGLGLGPAETVRVTQADFTAAMREVQPAASGASSTPRALAAMAGPYRQLLPRLGPRFDDLLRAGDALLGQAARGGGARLSCLIQGARGTGKSALAATLAQRRASDFHFVRVLTPDDVKALSEGQICELLQQVGARTPSSAVGAGQAREAGVHAYVRACSRSMLRPLCRAVQTVKTAQASPRSLVVLDNLERFLRYAPVGPHFSNPVLQTLLSLLQASGGSAPTAGSGNGMVLLATTSDLEAMQRLQLAQSMDMTLHVPLLDQREMRRALAHLGTHRRLY